jgi:uncharacterized RDD family membrane protein YckC
MSGVYECLVVLALVLVASLAFPGAATGRLSGLSQHIYQLYLFMVVGLYFTWCWTRGGQTLPMRTWRIRLARADGRIPGTGLALARFVAASLMYVPAAIGASMAWKTPGEPWGWMLLAPGAATLAWPLADANGRFLHDRLAGTFLQDLRPPKGGASPQ